MKVPDGCVVFRDGPGEGPIVSVQDHFGKMYRRLFSQHYEAGEVFANRTRLHEKGRSMTGDGTPSPTNFRVFKKADVQEVADLIRRCGFEPERMDRNGTWYEGITD